MPTYDVSAPDGRRFRVDGDTPPTESDLDEIFKASRRPAAAALEDNEGFHIAPSEKPLEQIDPVRAVGKGFNVAGKSTLASLGDLGNIWFRPVTEQLFPEQAESGAMPLENIQALKTGQPLPTKNLRSLPKSAQVVGAAAQGLIETTPRLAGVAALQAGGVPAPLGAAAIFGATEEGFDKKQAAIAAALPFVGKYSGAMVEALAGKLGVTKDVALSLWNKLGGATGAAGYLATIDQSEIANLPPEQRAQAQINSWANIAGQAALGVMGEPTKKKGEPNATQERPQPESNQPEHIGTEARRVPAEAGGSNQPEPVTEAQPNVPPKEEVAPEFAKRFPQDSLFQVPSWVEPGSAFDKALNSLRESRDAFTGKDVTGIWKSLTPEQRQDLAARGWAATSDRNNKIILTPIRDALSARTYYGQQNRIAARKLKETSTEPAIRDRVAPQTVEPSSEAAPEQTGAAPTKPELTGMGAAVPAEFSALGPQEQRLIKALSEIPAGKEGKDSPRISVADKVGDAVAVGKDAMTKWWLRTKAGAEQYKRLLLGAPLSENDFWKNKKDWQANRQVNSGVAREMIDQGKTLFPKQLHRQAMGKYAESLMFDNPNETLAGWARDAKLAKNRQIYEAAKNLTPDQKSAVLESIRYYEKKGQELQDLGLLGKLIEDYAGQHMVDMSKNTPSSLNQLRADLVRGTFNTNFKYAMQRMFETEFDLEQSGRTLKTTDLFDKLANYAKSANDVLADRNAIKQWMDGETEDGKPLFATGQNRIPIEGDKNDALLVNPKVRPDPVWKDKNGEQQDISGEYVKIDHPAFRKWQWAETDPNGKQIFVQGDVWAHKSIADELKNTFGRSRLYDIPGVDTLTRVNSQLKGIKLVGLFHQVKTAVHAMTHLTNPWGQPKIDPHDPFTYDAMRSGLQLFEPRNAEIFSEGLSSSSVIHNIPGLGPRLRAYQEYLFQDYIPRIKLATYRNALDRNMARYGKELPEQSIKQITANQINSAYGEMNWRLLGINPTFQHFLRLALLAPDFQSAQHGFVAQMFTKTGGENRMSAAIMIAGVYTAARVLNMLFDKDPHFEPKRAFGVVIGGREYGIRTIASDAMRAYTDTSQYIYHRLSPTASSAAEFVSKVDALGRKENTKQALENIALRGVPMPVTPRRDLNFVESALASTFGYYAKRQSPISDVSEIAKKWREKNDPKYRDETVQYPISQYQSLRQALQDNDLKQARTEYEKLLKTDKPALINRAIRPYTQVRIPGTDLFENHYHPFAGSRKNEREFYNSLSDAEKKVYDRARLERLEEYRRFQKMLEARRNQ